MKRIIAPILGVLFVIIALLSCYQSSSQLANEEIPHYLRKENFTVFRVLIMNSENQILMTKDQGFWGMPWVNLTKRQFLKEAIDSMAMEHGIVISNINLRGQFCFKYDYKPNVTFRNYYVVQYESGQIKIPKNTIESKFENIEWVEIPKAIERNDNHGIKEIIRQIFNQPDEIWGGSFMVSHTEDDHPTVMVEEFYPLFNSTKKK